MSLLKIKIARLRNRKLNGNACRFHHRWKCFSNYYYYTKEEEEFNTEIFSFIVVSQLKIQLFHR